MEREKKIKNFKIISIIVVLSVVTGVESFILGSYGFGCGIGLLTTFDCRIILPLGANIFIFHVLLTLALIPLLIFKPKIASKLILIFIAALLFLVGTSLTYSSTSSSFKLAYLEGFTEEACDNGEPAVPWGYSYDNKTGPAYSQQCYKKLRICEKITHESNRDDCYFRLDSNYPQYTTLKSIDECSLITRESTIKECELHFGKLIDGYKACETIVDQDANSKRRRYDCFVDVVQQPRGEGCKAKFEGYRNHYSMEDCAESCGIIRDLCYYWKSNNNEEACELIITSSVLKDDCLLNKLDSLNDCSSLTNESAIKECEFHFSKLTDGYRACETILGQDTYARIERQDCFVDISSESRGDGCKTLSYINRRKYRVEDCAGTCGITRDLCYYWVAYWDADRLDAGLCDSITTSSVLKNDCLATIKE